MKNKTPLAQVDGFRAVLLEDGHVPIFDGPMLLGRGFWNRYKRRIEDMPERVPVSVRPGLSQGLKLAVLATKVREEEKRKEVKKKAFSRPAFNTLFREFRERAFPNNFTRWAKVQFRQTFVAIVVAEKEAVIYRNWTFIGKGRWNPHTQFVEQYEGQVIPANVWARLTQGLTEYVVARSKA